MNLSLEDITNAIANYDNDIVENYVNSNFNNLNNIDLLQVALVNENYHVFTKLLPLVDIEDKNDYFIRSLNCLPIAMFLLETYSDYFQTQNNMVDLPGNKYFFSDEDEELFTPESKLPRYYKDVQYNNNKEAFTALLLNYLTDIRELNGSNLKVLDNILKNRNNLGIKDDFIIQCIVENNYEIYNRSYRENEEVGGSDIEYKKNLECTIRLLIENNIDCSSDMNGYLIQFISYNRLNKMDETLTLLVDLGSNVKNFLERIKNSDNWLTAKEQQNLNDEDYNHDRTYDIYKKFDKYNKIDSKYIDFCELLNNYINLENKIPNKQNNITNKIKL